MNRFEKYGTMLVAVLGAGAGLWSAYIVYDSEKFKQPLDKHTAIVKSFTDQISSASQRKDEPEVLRVRKEYESFEESWRTKQQILTLIDSSIALPPAEVSSVQKELVASWVSGLESSPLSASMINKNEFANALFVAGNYQRAAGAYQTALAADPNSTENWVGLTRAYGYLSVLSDEPELQIRWHEMAVDSAKATLTLKSNVDMSIVSDKELSAIIQEAKKQLTKQSSRSSPLDTTD